MVRITAEKQFVELMLLSGVEMPQQPQTVCQLRPGTFQLTPLPALSSGMGKSAAAHCFPPWFFSCVCRDLSACPTSLIGDSCDRAARGSFHL